MPSPLFSPQYLYRRRVAHGHRVFSEPYESHRSTTKSAGMWKLREAYFFLGHLVAKTRTFPSSDPEEFEFFLSAFLSAARSVTFALQAEKKDTYDTWFPEWKAHRSIEDLDFLKAMNAQRVEEVHKKGASVNVALEHIPVTEVRYAGRGHPAYYGFQWSGPPGIEVPWVGLPVHYFKLGESQAEVVATCTRYLDLLDQMIRDFLKVLFYSTFR